VTKGRSKRKVQVRVPEAQPPFFTLAGIEGGDFVSLLWNWGDSLEVTARDVLGLLVAARNGAVVIGRRMTAAEQRRLRDARRGADHETHAHVIANEKVRWRASRR
jgi:hypothetical protein